MASLCEYGNGFRVMVNVGGRRRPIWLGVVAKREAERFRDKVEKIERAALLAESLDVDTSKWLLALPDSTHAKLVRIDLVSQREKRELGTWLDKLLAEKKPDMKPEGWRKLGQTKARLVEFFGEFTSLTSITPERASDWRQWLLTAKQLSDAYVRTHCGNARTMFAEALRRKLVTESPVAHLEAGSTPRAAERFITVEATESVLAKCPNATWRLFFGLGRLAGLRLPSESLALTWADVDLVHGRRNVRSVKTEHHEGHERRTVPINARLMQLLKDRRAECSDADPVCPLTACGYVRGKFWEFVDAAEVSRWTGQFQTLRASCEIGWLLEGHRTFVVCNWIGHSLQVTEKHYARFVPTHVLEQVTGLAQPLAQQGAESRRNDPQPATDVKSENSTTPHQAATCGNSVQGCVMEAGGIESPSYLANTPENRRIGQPVGADFGATDSDLVSLIEAWRRLTPADRSAVREFVRALNGGSR